MESKTKSNSVKAQTVQIANPVYGYAFKYFMDDEEVACKFVSIVLGEEVFELTPAPKEFVNSDADIPGMSFKIYRIAFTATIHTDEGLKTVIVEIQKAMQIAGSDFRKSLENRYQNRKDKITVKQGDKEQVMPVYYILVIEDRIVVTPEPKNQRSNDVEMLLSIFDQKNIAGNCYFLLNIQEKKYPKEYRPFIRRLERAAADPAVRYYVQDEDYILEHLRIVASMKNAIRAKQNAVDALILAEREVVLARDWTNDATVRAEQNATIERIRAEQESLLAEIEDLRKQLNNK
jgi:hypothetical protein